LQNIIDDSRSNWIRHKEKDGPKTLDQIRDDFEKDAALKEQGKYKSSILDLQIKEREKIEKLSKEHKTLKEKSNTQVLTSNTFSMLDDES